MPFPPLTPRCPMKKTLFTLLLSASALTHAQAPIESEVAAIKAVTESITEHQLTSLNIECLSFIVAADNTDSYNIEVIEKHDDICGGDPATAPRLFGYTVNKKTGELATDAMRDGIEWDGDYHPIAPKAQK